MPKIRLRSRQQWRLFLGLSLGLILGSLLLFIRPMDAIASVHTYQERPEQVTFRAQQSLRDRRDRAWQAVLFKRYQGHKSEGIFLRLVGFPGAVVVARDQPLLITTHGHEVWTAPRVKATVDLPTNVGQYDLTLPLATLQTNTPLTLAVPLQTNETAEIVVPPFVMEEWRTIRDRNPSADQAIESLL